MVASSVRTLSNGLGMLFLLIAFHASAQNRNMPFPVISSNNELSILALQAEALGNSLELLRDFDPYNSCPNRSSALSRLNDFKAWQLKGLYAFRQNLAR